MMWSLVCFVIGAGIAACRNCFAKQLFLIALVMQTLFYSASGFPPAHSLIVVIFSG